MEDYVVGLINSGEWKWMAVVGVGLLIVVLTLLVSLFRGITWPALLALIFGGILVGAPAATPFLFDTPRHRMQAVATPAPAVDRDVAALAKANQQAATDLAAALKEVKMAVDELGAAVASAGRRAALAAGADARSGTDGADPNAAPAMIADLDGFTKQIGITEDSLRELTRTLDEAVAMRNKLDQRMEAPADSQ